jgi:release factor glutamine methyltransferase
MSVALGETTVKAALARGARVLAAAGIAEARREARLLLGAALGLSPAEILTRQDAMLDETAARRFDGYLLRRAGREPAARILGRREFWSLSFALSPATLDPRPDSETLIEAVLEALPQRERPWRFLDLGTGTGCLLLALLSEYPDASGLGVERDPAAADVARGNAAALGMDGRARVAVGDWGEGVAPAWDAIVVNPPYIPSGEIAGLMPEVKHFEPRLALDGGADGLQAYRDVAPQLAPLLARQGIAAIELGLGQAVPVSRIMAAAGLAIRGLRHDLRGVARCLLLARN